MWACKKVDLVWIATPTSRLAMTEKADFLYKILGFCDDFLKKPAAAAPCTTIADFGGFQGSGKGAYLIVCNRRHCRRIHQRDQIKE